MFLGNLKCFAFLASLLFTQIFAQSCNINSLISNKISCACSQSNYSINNYSYSSALTYGYSIAGWIKTNTPSVNGNIVYAVYTTSGQRIYALHLQNQLSNIQVLLFGQSTNSIYQNTFPYAASQWVYTAVTIYQNSFDLFIMRPYNPTDLVSLANPVSNPDFQQVTAGFTLKACTHQYQTYYSFCGYMAYFSLLTFNFKNLSSDDKLRLMYSGGLPLVVVKYDLTSFKTTNYEIDGTSTGHNIYQSQYQLQTNNQNMFDLKVNRPTVPLMLNPIYPQDGDNFPYPGFTVSFWCYVTSIASQSNIFVFQNENASNNLLSVSSLNDAANGYFKFCVYNECYQSGSTNPANTWIQFTFSLRNQQINSLSDGAIIEYYTNGLFQKKIQFNTKYTENPYQTNVINFSSSTQNSVYLKYFIIQRGVMVELTGSSCIASTQCLFSLMGYRCVLCAAGYSLTSDSDCSPPTNCKSSQLNKIYIKDPVLNICQEKCDKTCKDCDQSTRVCSTCFNTNINPPTCSCPANNIYKDDVRGFCSTTRADEHSQIRVNSETTFANAGQVTKIVTLLKNQYNILNIIALTQLSINKNSNSQNDIQFYVSPQSDSSSVSSSPFIHFKNANIMINNLVYSYIINQVGQQGITVKNIVISIPQTNSLRISGSGSYVQSYAHQIRDYTPYVSIFLTGYGLVKGNLVDIQIQYSTVTREDMIITIQSQGDSPIYQVNLCIVFSRFMTTEQQVQIPSYISTYPTDFQGARSVQSDFTVSQQQQYYVPFIYGLNSISYTATQDMNFALTISKSTQTTYNYYLEVSSNTQIKSLKFTLLRFQPIATVDNTTTECFTSCTECSVSSNTCTTCSDANRVPPLCSCAQSYFTKIDGTCSQCSQICKTCTLSATNCTQCFASNTLSPPNCACMDGFTYVGTDYTQCLPCSNMCQTCSGTQSTCTKCNPGRINFPSCTCPDSQYDDGVSKACQNCPPQCTKCTSNSSCSECKSGYVLIGNQCQQCSYKCSTCQNADVNNCSACSNSLRINAPGCNCQSGYFDTNTSNPVCQQCNIYCSTCVNSATNCQSCNGNRIFDGVSQCNCPPNSLNPINGSAFCETCSISGATIQYSQDYSQIYITFTYSVLPSNTIASTITTFSAQNCQSVLGQSVVNNLGQGYTCALSADSKTFVIKLGYASTVSNNVIISFNNFQLKSNQPSCTSTYITSFANNQVIKPNTSQIPIALLSTNTQNYNVCQQIQIYVSSVQNSGGRSLQNFVWNEVSNKVQIPSAYANQPILVFQPNTLTANTNYQFILTYTSSYGVAGQSTIQISTQDNSDMFYLQILNGIDGSSTYQFYTYQGIYLKATIQFNSCVSSFDTFTVQYIQWQQQFGSFNGIDLKSNKIENSSLFFNQATFNFVVNPYIPVPKDKYQFNVEANVIYNGKNYLIQQTVYIQINQSPFIVQIIGGDTVKQWNQQFTLAAYVFDPDSNQAFSNNNQVSISWTCTDQQTGANCLWQDGTLFKDQANNQLTVQVPERTFQYFQRIYLNVVVRKANLDGTIQQGSCKSQIVFLDYQLQSFQLSVPPQLSQGYISFTDKILFQVTDTNLISQFQNQIDSLAFKTSIQYQNNFYFTQALLSSFYQYISLKNLFQLIQLDQKDTVNVLFEIDSPQAQTQFQTSYEVFVVDSPKSCVLNIATNAISVQNCISQYQPLQYRISLYLAQMVQTITDMEQIQNHEYITLHGVPFSISNTFSFPQLSISFNILPSGSTQLGYVIQVMVQDSNGSVSSQVYKISNLVFQYNDNVSQNQQIPVEAQISIATIQSYLYIQQLTTNQKYLMSQLRLFNDEAMIHFNLYQSKNLEYQYKQQSSRRVLLSEKERFLVQSTIDQQIIQNIIGNITTYTIPQIFKYEVIWSSYKKFRIYHTQERLLFSTFRLIESLILTSSQGDVTQMLYNTLISLCQQALVLTQINNQPLVYQGTTLAINLAQYTSQKLTTQLQIIPYNPSQSIAQPYKVIQISQYSSTMFTNLNSFPEGIQRSPIITNFIRQSNSNIILNGVYPVYLKASLGKYFNSDLFVCISYRTGSQNNNMAYPQQGQWTSQDCTTVMQPNTIDVICYCKTLDPVVLLEDTHNIFINPSNTDLHSFRDIFSYPILILLISQLIVFIILSIYGVMNDEVDLVKVNQTVVPYSLVVPNGANQKKLEQMQKYEKELQEKEKDIAAQKEQIAKDLNQLKQNIDYMKQVHDKKVQEQQQQIIALQQEQNLKLENQQRAYEARIKELQQNYQNNYSLDKSGNQENIDQLQKSFQKQLKEQHEQFSQQKQQLISKQKEEIKQIEEEEKDLKLKIEKQEKEMQAIIAQLNPEEEKNIPKNPIQRVVWLMQKQKSKQDVVIDNPKSEKQTTPQITNDNFIEDISPLNVQANKNGNEKPAISIFEVEKMKLIENKPEERKYSNKDIISLIQIEDIEQRNLFEQKEQQPPVPIQSNQIKIPQQNIVLSQIQKDLNQENKQDAIPLSLNYNIVITLKVILKAFVYIHEFFSALITFENQISRPIRFSLIFLKYILMAELLGLVQNSSQYSLDLIFSIPLVFVVSIISNIGIFFFKVLIRSQGFKKCVGLILLSLSLIVVVSLLVLQFLNVKSPANKWWYAYLYSLGIDFILVEYAIILLKVSIFTSLYRKKQFHNNFDIHMWLLVSTNDLTNFLLKNH
ncbi:transmembrane protein, putative (macronuclear) [Tetrahymena thermophila SB210]|uniref:Transmembrane protein, putative n=1 Tax=Tetrahymena thermophila (strain SB210) TaxID=312017 RepID=I7LT88_TETTS|nr:transmembrane protein, putative [Tetrahymena thermophila SB210]EAR84801.2 transmembrane protein, putative [Tetrahymena thermophila SB210]|eukprot:XP_001032464.2 transmembrane protein, putative [Tetrahymena thermophila SB210]